MANQEQRIVILGASRGLGWAIYTAMKQLNPEDQFLLVSRQIEKATVDAQAECYSLDFSIVPLSDLFLKRLIDFQPTLILYVAGGGPYGFFESKKWSDHQWALNVNFIFPAQLAHHILAHKNQFQNLKTILFVGSSIAEADADPKASSYCAAKHALKGLVTTIQLEKTSNVQFKLFSPGYMQTDLLPANSAPRLKGQAESVEKVAEKLIDFLKTSELVWP